MFAAECIHCGKKVGAPVERIGEEQAAILRQHLRECAPPHAHNVDSVGGLLNHFRVSLDPHGRD
jgi:hypothetical protein